MLAFTASTSGGVFQRTLVPNTAHVELLWNRVSFCELEFDDDAESLASLGEGARVDVRWDGDVVLSGPVVEWHGVGPDGTVTVTVEDDFRDLRNLCWPKPESAITSQSDEFKRYTGTTEDVAKAALADLSTVLGFGWTVQTTTGLGSAQRVEVRFDPFVDVFLPLLEQDGLTLSLSGGLVDVTEGALFPRVLTVDSGVLGDYEWTIKAPTVTRPVVGGAGDGASRTLRQYVDTARETLWGFKASTFVDAKLADGVTDLEPDADVALAEGAAQYSVTSQLVENDWFRFGTYKLGDRVHVQVGPVDVTEIIRAVVIDDDPSNGLVVVPSIGEVASTDDRLGRQVAQLARGVRAQGRR